jgi:hypothetical protein
MSDRTFERVLGEWLESGSDRTAPAVVDAVLLAIKTTPQERDLRIPRRFNLMPTYLRLAVAAALIAVVGFGALTYLGNNPGVGGPPPATATPVPTPSPTPAATVLAPLDTSGWLPYTSNRYRFTMRMPASWTAEPADHDWTWENDASNSLSVGADRFHSADGNILVSAWRVPLTEAQMNQSWPDVEAWAKVYCEQTKNTDCATIHDRVAPMCVEKRDCHPALLIPFKDDVQAFANGGDAGTGLVVAVWRGESAPATASYGGSQRLLEGFLETLNIVPPFYPESQDAAARFVLTGE